MRDSVEKDLMSGDNNANISQKVIPCTNISPSLRGIRTAEELDLDRPDLRPENPELLFAQGDRRSQKPNDLSYVNRIEETGYKRCSLCRE